MATFSAAKRESCRGACNRGSSCRRGLSSAAIQLRPVQRLNLALLIDRSALAIAEERTTYRYDADSNMVRAENNDALVARGYYPNGALRTDSLSLRSLNGADLTHHYGLTYGYTLSGQVSSMQHPTNLAGSQAWDQFGYYPVTGALGAMSDRLGHYFEFYQNYAGQTTSVRGPYMRNRYYARRGAMEFRWNEYRRNQHDWSWPEHSDPLGVLRNDRTLEIVQVFNRNDELDHRSASTVPWKKHSSPNSSLAASSAETSFTCVHWTRWSCSTATMLTESP